MEKQTALNLGQSIQHYHKDYVVVLKSKVTLEPYNNTNFVNATFTFLYFNNENDFATYIYDYIYKDANPGGFLIRYSLTQNEIKIFNKDKNTWVNFKLFNNLMFQNIKTALNSKLASLGNKYTLEEAPVSPPTRKRTLKQ